MLPVALSPRHGVCLAYSVEKVESRLALLAPNFRGRLSTRFIRFAAAPVNLRPLPLCLHNETRSTEPKRVLLLPTSAFVLQAIASRTLLQKPAAQPIASKNEVRVKQLN
jgi:hypothetical protein